MNTIEETPIEQTLEQLASKSAYLVMCPGFWGRGNTPAEAARAAKASGARADMSAILYLVIGDDKPEINEYGHTVRDQGSIVATIGMFKRLSTIGQIVPPL